MTFKLMAYVMTAAGCLLGLRFIFAGASVLRDWGIEATDGPLVICRRIGVLYLGLALGPCEFWAGRVSSGIIVPAIVAMVFLLLERSPMLTLWNLHVVTPFLEDGA